MALRSDIIFVIDLYLLIAEINKDIFLLGTQDKADIAQTTSKNEYEFEALLKVGPPNDTTKAGCVSGICGLFVCHPDDCPCSSKALLYPSTPLPKGNIEVSIAIP